MWHLLDDDDELLMRAVDDGSWWWELMFCWWEQLMNFPKFFLKFWNGLAQKTAWFIQNKPPGADGPRLPVLPGMRAAGDTYWWWELLVTPVDDVSCWWPGMVIMMGAADESSFGDESCWWHLLIESCWGGQLMMELLMTKKKFQIRKILKFEKLWNLYIFNKSQKPGLGVG